MRADLAVRAPGDADAADVAAAPRPGRAAIGAQALVVRLGVERDDADAAQIGQLGRWLPSVHLYAADLRCDPSTEELVFFGARFAAIALADDFPGPHLRRINDSAVGESHLFDQRV